MLCEYSTCNCGDFSISDVSTDDAKNAFMPAMQHFQTLVQRGSDERQAYKDTVAGYHEAIFHGYDLPAVGNCNGI